MSASDTILTIVPAPIPGESGPGYLMRAFSINGQGWSRDHFGVAGFSIAAVVHGNLSGPIEAFLGQDGIPECLVSPVVTGKRVALGGEELHREDWTSRQRRWCPDCWRGDLSAGAGHRHAYWNVHRRPWWDVTAISACPIHRTRLAAHCPDCGEGVSWHHGSLTRCRNGHDLLRCEAVALDADDCRADAYLAGRLGGAPLIACDALDGLTLVDAVGAMERLGAAWLDENAGMARLRAELGRGALMNAGYRVAADLPRHAVSLLDRVRAGTDGRRRGWGVEHAYGGLHSWIRFLPDSPLAAALRDAIADHMREGVLLKTGFSLEGVPQPGAERLTLVEAAEICGVSHSKLRRIAVVLGMMPAHRVQGAPAGLKHQDVEALARRLHGSINLDELSRELAVPPAAAKRLVARGLIEPVVPRTGRSGPSTWLFPGNAASDLLGRLDERSRTHAVGSRTFPLPSAAQAARASTADVVELALSGDLAITRRPEGQGLHGFQAELREVRRALRQQRSPGLSPAEFATLTGIPRPAVWDFTTKGIIASCRDREATVIPPSEVERFKNAYVDVPELVVALGTGGPRTVMAALTARGIQPACARPQYEKILYRREEALAAVRTLREERTRAVSRAGPAAMGVTAKDVARRLRIDRVAIYHLVRTGALACIPGPRRPTIVPEDADRLAQDCVSGTELAELLGKQAAAAVAPLLRDAGIEPRYALPDGGYALYPRDAAVAAVLDRRAEIERREAGDGVERVHAAEVSRLIDTTDVMVAQLMRSGHLSSKRMGRKIVVPRTEVNAFRERYILGNELDRLIGSSGGAATKLLRRNGVVPICDRPAFYSVVFERAAAMPLVREVATREGRLR